MKKKLLFLFMLFCTLFVQQKANSQVTLSAGDIAFIGYNTSPLDGFSFITLKTIPAGTIIYFTEQGWNGAAVNPTWVTGSTETHMIWTVPALTPAGTIVSVMETSADTFTIDGTSGLALAPGFTGFNLAGGDQILAYQSTTGVKPISPDLPTFIAGVHGDYNSGDYDPVTTWNNPGTTGGNSSALPLGLTNGVNCISLFPGTTEIANSKLKASVTLVGSSAQVLATINNAANWDHNATVNYTITPVSYPVPAITTAVAPTVTTTLATNIGAVRATIGGEVTADGGDASIVRGVVWSTSPNPTVPTNAIQIGTGTGTFLNNIGPFPPSTTIYYRAYATNSGGTGYGAEANFATGPALSTSATSFTNVSCFGGGNGTATVVATGGKIPYTYSWSPSGGTNATATGLSQGNYTVTITDGESTQITRPFTISQPAAALNGTPSTTAVSCFGGSNGTATITPTGGTSPYTYLWSNGATTQTITGLLTGIYSVTITDFNGCPRTITNITVGTPAAALNATASSTGVSCFGGANGTATVVPSGGTPGYTYSWSPSGGTAATATGLSPGTYSVTVTDANACTKIVSNIVVGSPAAALDGIASSTPVSCFGGANGTATVIASGGTPGYTYSWAPSGGTAATATGLAAGTYSVTITDANSCTKTINNIVVGSPASAVSGIGSSTPVSCFGGANGTATVLAIGGTPGYTYSWAPSGGTNATATGLAAGTYSVTITDANACTAIINNIVVGSPAAALDGIATSVGVSCFGGSNGTATITPSGGTPGYTYLWSTGATTSSITGLTAGTYNVTITDANACSKLISNILVGSPVAALSGIASSTGVSCFGGANGTATVIPTGGTPGYTYSWSPTGGTAATATGLSAGTYSVTITDANACSTTVNNIVVGSPVSSVSGIGSSTPVSCFGGANGTATVIPAGGTPGYTYSWSPTGGTAATATGLTAGTYSVTITDANACSTTINNIVVGSPASAVSGIASATPVSCFGGANGTATVIPAGGTPGYTFSWAPSGGTNATATGLAAGTYSVTITDANACTTIINNIVVGGPAAALNGIASTTSVSCFGGANGTATIVASGGTAGYTYLWSNGATTATTTGLIAGTYGVTITDANLCEIIISNIVVGSPAAALSGTASTTAVSCFGGANGTATVVPTGGTPGYTYSWSPSGGTAATATGLVSGTYSVTVTDANACTTTINNIVVGSPAAALTATAGPQTDVSCNGGTNGSATVTVSGGTPGYTYSWAPTGGTAATASGLAAGTYTVTVTDANGCTAAQSFTITQPSALIASVGSQTDVTCNGSATGSATVSATGGTGTYTYTWSPSGGTAATATGLIAGTYTATVTDANGCTAIQSFTIDQPSALVVSDGGQTNVSCNSGANGSATVTVSGGTPGYTYSWAPAGGTAATAIGLSAGTYVVTVTDANGCFKTQSFTISEPSVLAATASQTDVSCNGGANGSATVTVTGGTGAYTYSWAPYGGAAATATGLSAGTYTVTVSDANTCMTTASVTITEPTILSTTTSITNVNCIGGADGSATVTVSGGTPGYTYSWAPYGGTAATASGLIAGTYTVTITDANGCTTTESVTINTIPDTTAPVPDVTNLPNITNYCAVLSSQITFPTATDSCAGVITATTASPLNYPSAGNYVITWIYDDGYGNVTTQDQNVIVSPSPLGLVTFSNATVTYDGNAHPLQVVNLPAGATVTYSANNTSVNAGTYSVTATITPSASTPNCSPVVLTANLVINKAAQQITFGIIPVKTLGLNNTFNLTAASNSNLAVTYTYTYTSALPAATVSATGEVIMLRSGLVLITAHQAGNSNYLAATDVTQLLTILNNNIDVKSITLGTQVFNNPAKVINYVMGCGETNPNVSIVNESGATITPSSNFVIQTPKPGIYNQNVTITSQDGTMSATYAISISKPFGFFDIVRQKFNNVLLVNNNPQTNGGYEFVSYEWFKNGTPIGTGQYYSAGNGVNNTLDPTADYMVKMTTKDGKVLQTCSSKVPLTNKFDAKLYPNPIQQGKVVTVEADFPAEELENMQISLYSVSGQLVKTLKSSTVITEVQMPESSDGNMYMVVIETANFKKTLKVLVK